jgi:hypothetical protein
MKHALIALVVAATSVLAFGASFSAQHGHTQEAHCDCFADATYYPGTWGGINCNGTFGITWTKDQDGMCSQPACTPQPCKGSYSVSATGDCSSMTADLWTSDHFPFQVGGTDADWTAGPYEYELQCNHSVTVGWQDDAAHTLTCEGCE